jgi:hypothetical protein
MKNILSILLVSLVLVSCSESIPYEKQVVEELRQQMKNPDSFRLDSLKYEPKYLSKGLEELILWDSLSIESDLRMKTFYEDMNSKYNGYSHEVKNYSKRMDSTKINMGKNISLLDQIKGTEKDTLILHTYRAYYMAQNSFGAMIKGFAYMETTNGKKVYVDTEND